MKNLVKIYGQVSNPNEGKFWYEEANLFAKQVATKFNAPLEEVCAVFSILSPVTNFEQNKKDLVNFYAYHKGLVNKKPSFTTYSTNVRKAEKVINKQLKPTEAFNPKTASKTLNFFRNILDPNDKNYVTIDRWAYRIATEEAYKPLTKKQYDSIANQYKRAAKRLGLLPSQLQAILWVDVRNKEAKKFETYCPF